MIRTKTSFTSSKIVLTFLLASVGAVATAQDSTQQSVTTNQIQSTMISGQGAPVTVNWGQPGAVPNAADYQVKVADLDKNGDGVISRNEVPVTHALSSEFKLVDKNQDGRINQQELAAWH